MDWFQRVTGFSEGPYEETRDRLQVADGYLINDVDGTKHAVGHLELVSLHELRARSPKATLPGPLQLEILEGDIRSLHTAEENEGAVIQVASQFNLLEMINPNVTPENGVTSYAYDRTQGPACAIAAGAGTIWRNYLVPIGDQIGQTKNQQLDGLSDLRDALALEMETEPASLWKMQNGYALPDREMLAQIEAHLHKLDEAERDHLRGLLRVGVHTDVGVTEPGVRPGTKISQIYASALPIAYSGIPAQEWRGLASLVLEAAYEATLHAALINAARGNSKRLLLTRLGGGVFGNDEKWISDAILRSLNLFKDYELTALMVSYGPPSQAMSEVKETWLGKNTN